MSDVPDPSICPGCLKPHARCVCKYLQPLETRVRALILQHPQEPDKELGSAWIAHRMLRNSELKIGLSWRSLRAVIGEEVTHAEWGVLYLGSVALPRNMREPVVFVTKKGTPIPEQEAKKIRESIRGLVVLDGTWSQAKALWWRNPWLLKLRRLVLNPTAPSLYGKLRREPRRESVSTIESLAIALSYFEHDPSLEERLLVPFRELLKKHARTR